MEKVLQALHRKKENSICFDCREKGTAFVNTTLGTFVCTKCSGLLRELHFAVKGLGVTDFKHNEVVLIEEMGNEKAKKIWLDKFADIKGFYPNAKDFVDFQEHLQEKYILKRFYADNDKDKISTKDNSYQSSKSCEIKKTQSAINSSNNSLNNSTIFSGKDFNFDAQSSQSETVKPSKFKKFQSSSEIVSPLKVETNNMSFSFAHKPKNTSIPLTTRKSDTSIVSSSLFSQPEVTNRNMLDKSFDFSHCNSLLTKTTSTNVNNTTVTTTNTSNANSNLPIIHDFTKSMKMMDNLNTLYSGYTAEKKVDPLDQLFYQYNFSSGNHMRMNANSNMRSNDNSHQVSFYNNQPQPMNNRGHLDSIYGIQH